MPVAPSIDDSSSGELTAARAASAARFSPGATPMPISAVPASRMIVRTSAKSRLIMPGHGDQVGDALDALAQHVVGHPERLESGVLFSTTCSSRSFGITISVSTFSESSAMPRSACCAAAAALEAERPRDDADGERLELARELGDDGRGAGAGAAALAGGDEDHVGALQRLLQLVAALDRGRAADARVGAGAEAAGHLRADVDLHVGVAHQQRLRVGVHGDELDAVRPASTMRLTAFVPPPPTPTTLITAR